MMVHKPESLSGKNAEPRGRKVNVELLRAAEAHGMELAISSRSEA